MKTPKHHGVMSRLDHRGHGPVARWTEDKATHVNAAQVFGEHVRNGYTMYDISDNIGHKLDAFDPAATEILATPRMRGG